MPIKNWDTRTVKQAVLTSLEKNGEAVGLLVKQDAKRRLLAIRDPEWGAGYRRFIVGGLLDFAVERGANEVTISVGVKPSPDTRYHGFYIEMGSRTHGPQPFLRPAVFQNGPKIVKLLES